MRNTRMGDEMILELAARLGSPDMNKTAAKEDDDEKEKKDKEEVKEEEEDKKDACIITVLNGLSKLASELDEMGADDASSAVDEALRIIVQNIQKEKE